MRASLPNAFVTGDRTWRSCAMPCCRCHPPFGRGHGTRWLRKSSRMSNERHEMTLAMRVEAPSFAPQATCWVCGGSELSRFHECRLDFREYTRQDPELAGYSDRRVWLVRCRGCGF